MPQRRLLDEVAANAVPAPVTRLVDGWLAKSAPELPFRRANSVLPPMAAGTDPSGQIPGLEGDRVGATDRTQRREEEEKPGEATSGEEVYAVTLDVYIGEEEAAPFLTLSTYLPVPESDRRVQPTTTGAPR